MFGENNLKRSSNQIDHTSFKKLMELTLKYNWLVDESEGLTELWNMCDSEDQQLLVESLISRFKVINSTEIKNLGNDVYKHITTNWKVRAENTLIVAISDNWEADGSQLFIQLLKNKFANEDDWSNHNFINSLPIGANKAKKGTTLILLDDFVGTGNTIIRKVNGVRKILTKRGLIDNVTIKVIAIAGMNFAISNLEKLNIEYYIPLWLDKGISDFYKGNDLSIAIDLMKELESKLIHEYRSLKLKKFTFGYERSESLFALEACNVPNNVFPIFWWSLDKEKKKRKTLFRRIR